MILIIANARIKGGLSGGDNIYLHIAKHCGHHQIWEMMNTDFKPFFFCYVLKIIKGCWRALWDSGTYQFVYSASDFWMDSLPAFILKLKGSRWVASCYMKAPKKNRIYYWSQKPILFLINHFADVICVTTSDVFGFKKPTIPIHGGVDTSLAYPDEFDKQFDAVFVGRFHHTKGISQLMTVWDQVLKRIPKAKLAVIGDGDDEARRLKKWMKETKGVTHLGFMEEDRFEVYRRSKIVLYPTPHEYSHFSMSPIEAMACGCPMIAFNLDVMQKEIHPDLKGCVLCDDISDYIDATCELIKGEYLKLSRQACEYGKSWDWDIRIPQILKRIKEYLYEHTYDWQ